MDVSSSVTGETDTVYSTVLASTIERSTMWMYIGEGAFVFLFNSIISCRLLLTPSLRSQKEYLMLAGCMLFDVLFGATYFVSGTWRAVAVYKYTEFLPAFTRWECLMTAQQLMFTVITPGAGYLVLVTALDRLYCVFFPIRYLKLHSYYGLGLLLATYALVIPTLIPVYYASYFHQNLTLKDQPMTCLLIQAIPPLCFTILRGIRIFCSFASVLVYIPLFIKLYFTIREHRELIKHSTIEQKNDRKMFHMTLTVSLITANTLCMFTIPDLIMVFTNTKSNWFYIMNLNKGMLNCIIFFVTQKTLRNLLFAWRKGTHSPNFSTINGRTTCHHIQQANIVRTAISPERRT